MSNNIERLFICSEEEEINIFTGRNFIVPIYQRNYSWGYDEIKHLIEDIYSSNDDYFIGTLVTKKKESYYEVIDGQQRLTTIYILLKYLGDISLPEGSLKFKIRDKSNKTLHDLGKDIDNKNSEYSEEIINGFEFVDDIIKENRIDIVKFKERLNYTILLLVEVPEDIDLNHYFEIMNTRGEQLEQHDIVKAALLEKLKTKKDQELFTLIWNACSDMNRYIQMSFTPRNIQLRSKIFGKYWDNIKFSDFNDLSEKYFSYYNENIYINYEEDNLNNIIITPQKQNEDMKKEEDEDYRFHPIINFPNFLLHALVTFIYDESEKENDSLLEDTRLIEMYNDFFNNKSGNTVKEFAIHLLNTKFYFDNYMIKRDNYKNDATDGEWSLYKLRKNETNDSPKYIGSFENNTNKNLMLQSCMRITFTSPKSMHWITRILNRQDWEDTVHILEKYAKEKLPAKTEFETLSGFDFPRICFTYLDYILWKKEGGDFKFQYRTSIEHFYPQNPKESEGFRPIKDEKILNSFGNLALINIKGNSKFSNMDPSAKRDGYPNVINQSLKLKIMSEKITGYKNMDDLYDRIRQHKEDMTKILYH